MSETTEANYAESVAGVLRAADLADPATAGIIASAVRRQVADPRDSFEVIVDDPYLANWRLKSCSEDRCRVRLACYRMTRRDEDARLERTVNDALSALEA